MPDGAATPPPAAYEVFGDRIELALRYAGLLAGAGIERGLLGPRELDRLWERHLLNCAVAAPLFPAACSVLDIGSGAGLPGIVLALARPDLRVGLVEPKLRRTVFLEECVAALALSSSVTVRRARAEELRGLVTADVVTARALAPLPRLVTWCWPLVRAGGALIAYAGERVAANGLEASAEALPAGASASVEECGTGLLSQPTTVVVLRRPA